MVAAVYGTASRLVYWYTTLDKTIVLPLTKDVKGQYK